MQDRPQNINDNLWNVLKRNGTTRKKSCIARAHPDETVVLDCEFPRPHADTTTQSLPRLLRETQMPPHTHIAATPILQ